MSTTTMQEVPESRLDEPLALLGGEPMVQPDEADEKLFHWPIVTREDEQAVLEVLRRGAMSKWDITMAFEREMAQWHGRKHALAYPNGTMAIEAMMWAAGLRRGDEIICPSTTYWASALPALSIGAGLVFADIDPQTLCINPAEIDRLVGPRTRAVMAVHYCGHPCAMDELREACHRHDLKLLEDVSHAHGGFYKGNMTGTFGDAAAMSLMAAKPLAAGEGGMLLTDDESIYEHAMAYSHYERSKKELTNPDLRRHAAAEGFLTALPMGGVKGRMNQTCAAMGRVQLKHYPERVKRMQRARNRFWDLLEGVPGLHPHRTPPGGDSTMGGWYNPIAHYRPEELGGLSVDRFVQAVHAEGGQAGRRANFPLHTHPLFYEADIYGDGRPTRVAFADADPRRREKELPVARNIQQRTFGIPRFRHDMASRIAQYAAAYRKVARQADRLLNTTP